MTQQWTQVAGAGSVPAGLTAVQHADRIERLVDAAGRDGQRMEWDLAGHLIDLAFVSIDDSPAGPPADRTATPPPDCTAAPPADRTPEDRALDAVSRLSAGTWLRLDRALRDWSTYDRSGERWSRILARAAGGRAALPVLLAACCFDGHRRERAVAAPVMRTDLRLLPVLVILTTDWVRQVHDRARALLAEVLADVPAPADRAHFLAGLGVVLQLAGRLRADPVVAGAIRVLRVAPAEALAAARRSGDRSLRRLAYEIWCEDQGTGIDALIGAVLAEPDIICRARCATTVVDRAVRSDRPEPLERLLTSRDARVRTSALTGLVRLGRPEHGRAYLADRSVMTRMTAQWAVRRVGGDPAGLYRAALAAGSDPERGSDLGSGLGSDRGSDPHPGSAAGLIAGLRECGGPDDVALVRPFLEHGRPRVRAAAVRAVREFGGDLTKIAEMVTDPSPAVVRAVTRPSGSRPDPIAPARYLELLRDPSQAGHVRLAAFRRLVALGPWERLRAGLLVLADPDVVLAAQARMEIRSYLGSGRHPYGAPDQVRAELRSLLDAAEPVIGPGLTRTLRWHAGLGCPAPHPAAPTTVYRGR